MMGGARGRWWVGGCCEVMGGRAALVTGKGGSGARCADGREQHSSRGCGAWCVTRHGQRVVGREVMGGSGVRFGDGWVQRSSRRWAAVALVVGMDAERRSSRGWAAVVLVVCARRADWHKQRSLVARMGGRALVARMGGSSARFGAVRQWRLLLRWAAERRLTPGWGTVALVL